MEKIQSLMEKADEKPIRAGRSPSQNKIHEIHFQRIVSAILPE